MNIRKPEKIKNSIVIKNEIIEKPTNMGIIIKERVIKIQEIIQKTILSMNLYKKLQIFSNVDIMVGISTLHELYTNTKLLNTAVDNIQIPADSTTTDIFDNIIEKLQMIVDKLALIITGYGTSELDDLLFISFGSDFIKKQRPNIIHSQKYELLQKYVHPIGYKTIHWKQINKQKGIERNLYINTSELCVNKMIDEVFTIELSNDLECCEIDTPLHQYHNRVHGLRVVIHNEKMQKTLIIQGICDDISLECITNQYIDRRILEIKDYVAQNNTVDQDVMNRSIDALTIKDLLIAGNNDIYKRHITINRDVTLVTQNKIDIVIKKFMDMDMYSRRSMLINLLIYNKNDEIPYIAYLLYDLISLSHTESIDSNEQILLYDSFPWKIKKYFKEAMKHTIKYSQDMGQKYDINRITLEQQIYLLKVPENVKEKASAKLKELKGKSDDSGAKAKQYLEGLLKIPFGTFKHEPILKQINDINHEFSKLTHINNRLITNVIEKKPKYTNLEILKYISNIETDIPTNIISCIQDNINSFGLKSLIGASNYINNIIMGINASSQEPDILYITGKTKKDRTNEILSFLQNTTTTITNIDRCKIYDLLKHEAMSFSSIHQEYKNIYNSIKSIENTMDTVIDVLDSSIYGHNHAKNQILKIIGQWMNGTQTGYCFGFEGSPGIGKTSLAKNGLSNCLRDENGVTRPFAFIALGGSCNGSTLEGHSYTYVNSIWGRIVDIIMETKCMNPIIYIDELDKVSKTEHGKEIIGILTHLIDSTQNDSFQDKYFSGIDIDMSKALFIFSYNDPDQIDRILLDRIHRIKFENLTPEDKLVIIKKYILPEIHSNMGLPSESICLPDDVINYIIEYYTMEPGIRKLKEILFDIYGEINIEMLKCKNYESMEYPIHITVEMLEKKYLKKYIKIHEKLIYDHSIIGTINGLWANSLGKGGILPIESIFFPSSVFLELKLTGLQGDVMKESMNVAKSLAWTLTPDTRKRELLKYFDDTRCSGLHIHCPEGAVSKDGPSAGAAITTTIYSLFNNKKIKNTFAMTGEIDLRGNITAIGGLENKIIGGIRAGVKTFLFPKSNNTEFQEFKTKYLINDKFKDITFIQVQTISDVFDVIFE